MAEKIFFTGKYILLYMARLRCCAQERRSVRMRNHDLADFELEGDDGIFVLSDGVGPRRRNRRSDVLKVETLLANAGGHDLEDGPTGYAGSQLDDAIREYQKRRGLVVDGILEPEGETIASLEREFGSRFAGWRAPRPDEADDHLNRIGRGEGPLFAVKPRGPILHPIDNLPEVDAGAWQSNRRTVHALFTTRDNGPLADLLADAIGHDGLDGVAETRDLLDHIRERSPERADAMARAVFDRLSEKDQMLFTGGDQPGQPPIRVMQAKKVQVAQVREVPPPPPKPTPPGVAGGGEVETPGPSTSRSQPGPDAPGLESGPSPVSPKVRTPFQHKVYDDPKRNPPGTLDRFNRATAGQPGATNASIFAIPEIFIVEGGRRNDPRSTASSGILQRVLDRAKTGNWTTGLENATRPAELSTEQRAAIMHRYLDEELKQWRAGGIRALEDIGNPHAAAALADTIYRHGGGHGTTAIQRAINEVNEKPAEVAGADPLPPHRVREDGRLGRSTVEAYGELARDPRTRGELLDALAKHRKDLPQAEDRDRIDHFRYPDER